MVRLTHLRGSLQGTSSTSPKAVIRIGRGPDCDVRFDAQIDTKVSTHHAEIRFEDGSYFVIDTGSTNGTLVNGKKVGRQRLRNGDKIFFGGEAGPQVEFAIDNSAGGMGGGNGGMQQPQMGQQYAPQYAPPPPQRKPPPQPDQDVKQVQQEAQAKIAMARAMAGSSNSGQTMFIMAASLQKVEETTKTKDKKKYGKVVFFLLAVGFVGFGVMGYIIFDQNQQIEAITEKKQNVDKEIKKVELQMQLESDPEKLTALEQKLTFLTGSAKQAIGEMERRDKGRAQAMENEGDELDREIKRILRKFGADAYVIPPLFKERLQFHIDATIKRGGTRSVYKRKVAYWPKIMAEFTKLDLPEEMAFVAWTESQFTPDISSQVGARGMWQFMPPTARQFGLRVDSHVDERIEVDKATRAAAQYLANLLAEFGGESFMLAIAAYNKGEHGLRKVLRDVAANERGGWRKEKRDFWHLYRLKKLPNETLEYVPQILAAAIICNNPKKYGLE
jgi:pSer/pThr/pTyr-binding forkhead associated (FHA) protein